jgi:hypothetical protein
LQPPCPRADRTLLESVYAYLDPKRPVAAEMYVIATEYVGLGLSVAVEVRSGFGLLQVSQQVEEALRAYLWPVPPGGSGNQGWRSAGACEAWNWKSLSARSPAWWR